MPESTPHQSNTNFTRNTIEAAIRLGLLLLLAARCFRVIYRFFEPVMWGVIIAAAIFPLFVNLRSAMGGQQQAGGGMLMSGIIGLCIGAVILALGYELFMEWLGRGAAEAESKVT